MSLSAQPALEDRELQPFTVTIHQVENTPPALLIADVVRYNVEMFFLHAQRVVKLGYSAFSPSRYRLSNRACSSSNLR